MICASGGWVKSINKNIMEKYFFYKKIGIIQEALFHYLLFIVCPTTAENLLLKSQQLCLEMFLLTRKHELQPSHVTM